MSRSTNRRVPRHTARVAVALGVLSALTLAGCGRTATSTQDTTTSGGAGDRFVTTTPAGTKDHGPITWAVYRDVQTADPIFAFDYPDNTAVTLLCESVVSLSPDGTLAPGLTTLTRKNPTTIVLDINPKATFWDGSPVTADDVVYSLKRNTDAKLGGFYGAVFSRVSDISASSPSQVTLTLSTPDYWLDGELASMSGVVIKKAFAEKAGAKYGTPSGGVMCTGAYTFGSWNSADGLVAKANPSYWKGTKPKVSQITLKGSPDEAALTSSLVTGSIAGSYLPAISTLKQLQSNSGVQVFEGPGYATDAFIVSNLKGTLGDVKVRQALSLALDRQGIIDTVYQGAAQLPHWFSNPGTFGYASSTFDAAYAKNAPMTQDLEKAKALIKEAGAEGKPVTIGMSSALKNISAVAGAYQAAGEKLGLKVTLKSVSAENYINFFIDPKAREGVDGFLTINYGDYADPASLLATIVLPDGSQNYDGFADQAITDALEKARGTADETQRATLVITALEKINEQLPWIPNVQPSSVLVMNKDLSGATASFAYMFAPWANDLGGR